MNYTINIKINWLWILGMVLAGCLSWNTYHHVVLCILHTCASWFYVIVYTIMYFM